MKCLLFLCFVSVTTSAAGSMAAPKLVGAFGNEKAPTPHVNDLFKKVELQLIRQWEKAAKSGVRGCGEIEPRVVSYMSQLVAGTNYIMKVEICPGIFLAIKVFEPLPYTMNPPQLVKVVPIESGEGLSFTLFTHQVVDQE